MPVTQSRTQYYCNKAITLAITNKIVNVLANVVIAVDHPERCIHMGASMAVQTAHQPNERFK